MMLFVCILIPLSLAVFFTIRWRENNLRKNRKSLHADELNSLLSLLKSHLVSKFDVMSVEKLNEVKLVIKNLKEAIREVEEMSYKDFDSEAHQYLYATTNKLKKPVLAMVKQTKKELVA